MFEQSLVETGHALGGRKPASVALSLGVQSLVLALAVVLPLLHSFPMPHLDATLPFAVPLAPAPAPAAAPSAPTRLLAWAAPQLAAPLPPLRARAAAAPVAAPAWLGGDTTGTAPAFSAAAPVTPAPPTLTPAAPPASETPLAIGGEIEAARCLACPPPPYPAFARQAGLEGTVVLAAEINPAGAVTRLSRVRGNAVLAAAAERAVGQWRYRPLRLDGRAVPVATLITVRFTLH
ncbi:MAG: energy transducer TonB [Terriglobales bacterium]